MAAKSSNGTGGGNWSAGATWSGGVVPVAGTDTVTIVPGDTVTIDAASESSGQLIIGSDPGTGGTAALTIGSSAQSTAAHVVVNASVVVRMRGDLTIWGTSAVDGAFSDFTMSSGSSLIMDPPSAGTYKFNFNGNAAIVSNGATNTGVWPDSTGGNHCIIKTDLARSGLAAVPVFQGGVPNSQTVFGGFMTHTFTEFSNIGNSTTFGVVVVTPNTNTLGHASQALTMTNCTFNACNYWISDDGSAGYWVGNYLFNDNIMSSSVACSQFSFTGAAGFSLHTAPTTQTKQILRCGFDLVVNLDGVKSTTIQGNVFGGSYIIGGTTNWPDGTYFANNVVVITANTTGNQSSANNCYYVNNVANPSTYIHVAGGSSLTGCVFEAVNGFGASAAIVFQATDGTCTLKCNLVIGINLAGYGSGYLAYTAGGSGRKFVVEHNLQISAMDTGMCTLGVGGAASSGKIVSCRANLIICASAGAGEVAYAITESGSSTYTLDAVTVGGYNGYNGAAVSTGTVKTSAGSVSTPSVPLYNQIEVTTVGSPLSNGNTQIGFGDISINPNFVDSTRGFKTWAGTATGGGVATFAGGLATLLANPGLITKASVGLLPWVYAGYTPTNSAITNTSYPGDTQTTDAAGNPLNGTIGPLAIPTSGGPFPYYINPEATFQTGGFFDMGF